MYQWKEWLNRAEHRGIQLGCQHIQAVARDRQWLPVNCPVITVGGTNGKGSCVAVLESIYLKAGYRVGCYTSPHLSTFNERIRRQGTPVKDEALAEAFHAISQHNESERLTYFEGAFLASLFLFQSTCDIIILEVGLGGRLDAVNIVDPSVSVITNIDFDHLRWLGADRQTIAKEKAGIMRSRHPLICGDPSPPELLPTLAKQNDVEWYRLGHDFNVIRSTAHWDWESRRSNAYMTLPVPNLALSNAACALMAIDCLQTQCPVSTPAIRQGLQSIQLLGRQQKIHTKEGIEVVMDVAHNPASTRRLSHTLSQESSKRQVALFGAMADKAIASMIAIMAGQIDEWHIVELTLQRAATFCQMEPTLKRLNVSYHKHTDLKKAYQRLLATLNPDDRLVVFGSFSMVLL